MPPELPKRKPSSPLIVREELAPGAIHDLKRIVPMAERPTSPPPAIPHDPVPKARPVPRTQTVVGMPAPPSEPPLKMRPKLDSREVAAETLLAELAAKGEEVRALRAELEAKKVVVEPAPPPDLPTRGQWSVLLYKFGGALVAILVPCGAYLAYRVETLAPRVTQAETKQTTQQKTTTTVEDRVKALESYNRALLKHSDCMDAERDSAIERGTGHTVEASHDGVQWFEQSRPALRPRILWETYPWYVTTPCPPKPYPPGDP